MQRFTHCLWFDGRAEEAAAFYVSVFKDSRIVDTARYPEGSPGTPGAVMTASSVHVAPVAASVVATVRCAREVPRSAM